MDNKLIPAKINLLQRYMLILQRCYDPDLRSYINYGAKGVTVCDEWLDSFEAFYEWAIKNGYEKGLHIDKDQLCEEQGISPKIYSPTTCQFITPSANAKLIDHTSKKEVVQYDLKGNYIRIYSSGLLAAEDLKVTTANINRCCNNLRGVANGYQWRFKLDNYKDNIGEPAGRKTTAKPILMLDKDTEKVLKEFPSVQSVNEYFGGVNVNVHSVAKGDRTQAKGYKWKYK